MSELFYGAVSWEVIRSTGGYFYRKYSDGKSSKKQSIKIHANELNDKILNIQNLALIYYSKPGLSDLDVSTQIKVGVNEISTSFSAINSSLDLINETKLPNELMMKFRMNVTMGLDSSNRPAWDLMTDDVNHILTASTNLYVAVVDIRTKMA